MNDDELVMSFKNDVKNGDGYNKFYFKPSKTLVDKLEKNLAI